MGSYMRNFRPKGGGLTLIRECGGVKFAEKLIVQYVNGIYIITVLLYPIRIITVVTLI